MRQISNTHTYVPLSVAFNRAFSKVWKSVQLLARWVTTSILWFTNLLLLTNLVSCPCNICFGIRLCCLICTLTVHAGPLVVKHRQIRGERDSVEFCEHNGLSSILHIDQIIFGRMIKTRSSYALVSWLSIVASNFGGDSYTLAPKLIGSLS